MDSMGLFSGRAGSADENIRSQNCPRKRIVDMRGRSFPIQTVFVAVWPPDTIFTSYLPSLDPAKRHTIFFSAGICTGGAVIVISGGRSSVTSFAGSLLAFACPER